MFNQLKDIVLQTRKKFFSNNYGEHISTVSGSAFEFNEVREYTIDDDIRHLNWKITARTRTPSVNTFFDNKQINVLVGYLNSGGLYFEENSKKNLALTVFTALNYITLKNKDSLALLSFDEQEKFFFEFSSNKNYMNLAYDKLITLDALNTNINYKELQNCILKKVKTKSIIFFVGDFLKLPEFEELFLNYEIYCCVIRDKKEENLSFHGDYNIVNTNSLNKKNMNIDAKTIKEYDKYMKDYDKKLEEYFKNYNIKYKKFYTHENPYETLRTFFKDVK
jgi:hypothetical protein